MPKPLPPHHIGDGRLLEEAKPILGNLLPSNMGSTGVPVAAGGPAEEALPPLLQGIEDADDCVEPHGGGRTAQSKSTSLAAAGNQDPSTRELVKDLGEVIPGDSEIGREVGDPDRIVVR
jgi:hypothetical protein